MILQPMLPANYDYLPHFFDGAIASRYGFDWKSKKKSMDDPDAKFDEIFLEYSLTQTLLKPDTEYKLLSMEAWNQFLKGNNLTGQQMGLIALDQSSIAPLAPGDTILFKRWAGTTPIFAIIERPLREYWLYITPEIVNRAGLRLDWLMQPVEK